MLVRCSSNLGEQTCSWLCQGPLRSPVEKTALSAAIHKDHEMVRLNMMMIVHMKVTMVMMIMMLMAMIATMMTTMMMTMMVRIRIRIRIRQV